MLLRPRAATSAVCSSPLAAPVGSDTILVVEDEERLRVLTSSILKRAGYRVLEAANVGEAAVPRPGGVDSPAADPRGDAAVERPTFD